MATKQLAASPKVAGAILSTIGLAALDTLVQIALTAVDGEKILNGKATVRTNKAGKVTIEFAKLVGKKRIITIETK